VPESAPACKQLQNGLANPVRWVWLRQVSANEWAAIKMKDTGGDSARVRRVTLKDVAAATGLSVATVSRSLGASPLIPERTRVLVQAAAARLGYERDPMLAALASYRKTVAPVHYHGTLALMLVDQRSDRALHKGLRQTRQYCEQSAAGLGYKIEEFDLAGVTQGRMLRQLAARNITGILFPPLRNPGRRLDLDLEAFSAVKIGDTLVAPHLNVIAPQHYYNTTLQVRRVWELGYRRIGFWLPRTVDERTSGAFSAAFWRCQQDMPAEHRLEICLPPTFDERVFRDWFLRNRPDFIISLAATLELYTQRLGLPKVPVAFPSTLGGEDMSLPQIDENWQMIYHAAIRLLDGMIRHGERGVPAIPRRIGIEGTLLPGHRGPHGS
jgi:LacI family transcriptional regulator